MMEDGSDVQRHLCNRPDNIGIAGIKLLKGGWHYSHGRHHYQQD